jgi:hypothetical protein
VRVYTLNTHSYTYGKVRVYTLIHTLIYCPTAEHAAALVEALGDEWIDTQAKRLGRWADGVIALLPQAQQQER